MKTVAEPSWRTFEEYEVVIRLLVNGSTMNEFVDRIWGTELYLHISGLIVGIVSLYKRSRRSCWHEDQGGFSFELLGLFGEVLIAIHTKIANFLCKFWSHILLRGSQCIWVARGDPQVPRFEGKTECGPSNGNLQAETICCLRIQALPVWSCSKVEWKWGRITAFGFRPKYQARPRIMFTPYVNVTRTSCQVPENISTARSECESLSKNGLTGATASAS